MVEGGGVVMEGEGLEGQVSASEVCGGKGLEDEAFDELGAVFCWERRLG